MEKITVKEIVSATGGTLLCGNENTVITSVTRDSREGGDGTLFIAFKGERVDGNDFVTSFLEKGSAAIAERDTGYRGEKAVILVKSSLSAIQAFAKYYRYRFNVPVVGITGSVGKTSTKEMMYSVLSQHFNTLKTEGNFNNEIGMPLTAFNISPAHEAVIFEMGMSAKGELSALTAIANPEIAVITNIGTAHIGILKSQENILSAKLEILENLKPDGIAVLNADDKFLYGCKGKLNCKTVYYGIDNTDADYVAKSIASDNEKSTFTLEIDGKDYDFTVNIVGKHHIYNALAAIISGLHLGIPVDKIQKGVEKAGLIKMRQNIIDIGKIKLIEDCYNASPASMKASMEVLKTLSEGKRSIAVLGDILEQGEFAEECHRTVGRDAGSIAIDVVVTVGNDTKYTADEAKKGGVREVYPFDNNKAAAEFLKGYVKDNDVVLFKGSRGMKLEEVSAELQRGLGV